MRIAVTSQNFRTVTPHAGVTRRFLVYEVVDGGIPREIDRWDFPNGMALRDFTGPGRHPLDDVDAVISGSAGSGFVRRMTARDVRVAVTSETDPNAAVRQFVGGTLGCGEPRDGARRAGDDACLGVRLRSQRQRQRTCGG